MINATAARAKSNSLLIGRIYDDRGNRMSPSHARKQGITSTHDFLLFGSFSTQRRLGSLSSTSTEPATVRLPTNRQGDQKAQRQFSPTRRKRGRLILSAARVLNLHNKDVRRAHNPRLKRTGLRRSDAADQGLRAGAIDRVGLSQDRRKERDAISPRNLTVGEVVCSSRGATSGSR
jgi:hypothetical protein